MLDVFYGAGAGWMMVLGGFLLVPGVCVGLYALSKRGMDYFRQPESTEEEKVYFDTMSQWMPPVAVDNSWRGHSFLRNLDLTPFWGGVLVGLGLAETFAAGIMNSNAHAVWRWLAKMFYIAMLFLLAIPVTQVCLLFLYPLFVMAY